MLASTEDNDGGSTASIHSMKSLKFDRRDQKDSLTVPNLFYCIDCMILCSVSDLILDGDHKDHNYIYAVEQAKVVRDDLAKHMKKTRIALPNFKERVKEVSAQIDSLNESHAMNVASVHKQFDKVIEKVNERRAMFISELEEARDRKLSTFQEVETKMVNSVDKVNKAFTNLSELTRDIENISNLNPSPVMRSKYGQTSESPSPSLMTSLADDSNNTGLSNVNITPAVGGNDSRSIFNCSFNAASRPSFDLETETEFASSGDVSSPMRRKNFRPRGTPPQATPTMLTYVRKYPQILQSVVAIQSSSHHPPSFNNVTVVFSCHLEVELLRYGRAVVQSAFRTSSRSKYGPVQLSPMNSCGLINHLGTTGEAKAFSNPTMNGLVGVKCSVSLEIGTADIITSKFQNPNCLTSNCPDGPYFTLSLDQQKRFVLTHFSIQHGSSEPSHALRSFSIEGTNTGDHTFSLIHSVIDDYSIGTEPYKKSSFEVSPPCHFGYNIFRVLMTGPNRNTCPSECWKMCLGGIELFGNLFDS